MNWPFKNKNFKIDLVDEFAYWYYQLKNEYQTLIEISNRPLESEKCDQDLERIIAERIELLNGFFAGRITKNDMLDNESMKEIETLIDDRRNFLDTTRKAFLVSHPAVMNHLKGCGLTERELNICCLYMIGLRSKEIGSYLGFKSHYNINSIIRSKLGLDDTSTNLSTYLKKIMKSPNYLTIDEKWEKSEGLKQQISKWNILKSAYYVFIAAFGYNLIIPNGIINNAFIIMSAVCIWYIFNIIYVFGKESLILFKQSRGTPLAIITSWYAFLILSASSLIDKDFYGLISEGSFFIGLAILVLGMLNISSIRNSRREIRLLSIEYGLCSVIIFFVTSYILLAINFNDKCSYIPSFIELFGSPEGIRWYFVCLWTFLMFFMGYGIRRYIGSLKDIFNNFLDYIASFFYS